jgi:hypothetical protein
VKTRHALKLDRRSSTVIRISMESGVAISCRRARRTACTAGLHRSRSPGGIVPSRTASADSEVQCHSTQLRNGWTVNGVPDPGSPQSVVAVILLDSSVQQMCLDRIRSLKKQVSV